MNVHVKLAVALIMATFLAACGNTKNTDTSHATHKMENTTAKVSLKDDKLNAVYQHYQHLTMALTNGDVAEAKVAAQAIELGAKELSNPAVLTALTSKISEVTTIEAQRTAYAALSADFISRVKASGLTSGELYVAYCPMAMNDQGASWLSNQKEIKNPHFGASMMTCGEVKETIK